jgi:hypothetical protein
LLRFWIIQKGVKSGFCILGISEGFQIETCCYINWWLISDHTITQGHHWVKHHMFDQMPLLVDQVDFGNSFNNSSNLNLNSNQKTCNKFWTPQTNSDLKLYFMNWTWAHTLQVTLVTTQSYTSTYIGHQLSICDDIRNYGFRIRVIHHRNTINLENVNLFELMHNMVNLIMNALQCIWWHDTFLVSITPRVL